MVTLLNSLGYFSTKYQRLLLPLKRIKMDEPREMTPRPEEEEIKKIKLRMKTRKAARNNLLVCATKKHSRGCTKGFPTTDELAMYILAEFGPAWRHSIVLNN